MLLWVSVSKSLKWVLHGRVGRDAYDEIVSQDVTVDTETFNAAPSVTSRPLHGCTLGTSTITTPSTRPTRRKRRRRHFPVPCLHVSTPLAKAKTSLPIDQPKYHLILGHLARTYRYKVGQPIHRHSHRSDRRPRFKGHYF